MQEINKKGAYFKGLEFFCRKDYVRARYYFEQAYQDNNFKMDALCKIIHIELREGKYKQARKLLSEAKESDTLKLKKLYGLLENIESNYESSRQYYNECMVDPKFQNKALLALAKLNVQTGDTAIAEKMFETLMLNKKFNVQANINLVCLNILEQNYQDAYRLLLQIDRKRLTPILKHHYNVLNTYLLYLMGNLKEPTSSFKNDQDYIVYRLFDYNDKYLLEHIKKHTNLKYKYAEGCFFKDMDLKKLLYEAKEKIETMNSNHFEVSDMYRFRLDRPIGFKGNEITKDLCVVTMIGSKDILTMYPVLLSDEFDKEKMTYSKQLALKRSRGRK